jgi:hypothetical protein
MEAIAVNRHMYEEAEIVGTWGVLLDTCPIEEVSKHTRSWCSEAWWSLICHCGGLNDGGGRR